MNDIRFYRTASGSEPVRDFLTDLERGRRSEVAAIDSLLYLLRSEGRERLARTRQARHLRGELWELRSGQHRIAFFWDPRAGAYTLVHAWKKEKGKAEQHHLRAALDRVRQHQQRG
jgi:phage-related protein